MIWLLLNLCLVGPSCWLHHISFNSWLLIRLLVKLSIRLLTWELRLEAEFFHISLFSLGIDESCQNILLLLIHLKVPALLLIVLMHHCLFQSTPCCVCNLRLIWQQRHLDSTWRSLHTLVVRVLTSYCSSHRWYQLISEMAWYQLVGTIGPIRIIASVCVLLNGCWHGVRVLSRIVLRILTHFTKLIIIFSCS